MRRLWAAVVAVLFLSGAAFPPRGGGGASGSSSPIVSVVPNSYALPTTASTNVGSGVVTTTFADSTSTTSAPLATTSTGTSADGSDCTKTQAADFDVSGNTLKTSSGYATQEWDYVCVTSSPPGHTPFTQLIALKRNDGSGVFQPQHTSVVAIGDGVTTVANQWPAYWQMLGGDYGWAATARGPGDPNATVCGIGVGTVISDATGTINADYRANPMWLLMVGGQDAFTQGSGYAAYEQTFKDCLQADVAWLMVPDAQKLMAAAGSGVTRTGSGWASYSATGLSAGTAMQTSHAGDSITFNPLFVTASNASISTGAVYLWWHGSAGASVTWQVDSGATTTITADAYDSANGVQMIRGGPLSRANHSIKLTLNSGTMVVFAAGTPPTTWAAGMKLAGILAEQGNANSAATTAYNTDVANIEARARADLLDVTYVPVQQFVNPAADMADALHPNAAGQVHLAQAFSFVLPKCIYGVPAPGDSRITANGMTCPAFDDEGTGISTVDVNNTVATLWSSGYTGGITKYNWYPNEAFPRAGQTNNLINATPNPNPATIYCDSTINAGDPNKCTGTGTVGGTIGGITGLGLNPNYVPSSAAIELMATSCGAASASATNPPFLISSTPWGGTFAYEDQIFFPNTTPQANLTYTGSIDNGTPGQPGTTLHVTSIPAAATLTNAFIDDGSGNGAPAAAGHPGYILTIPGISVAPAGIGNYQLLNGAGVAAGTIVGTEGPSSSYPPQAPVNFCSGGQNGTIDCPASGPYTYFAYTVSTKQQVGQETMTTANPVGPGDYLASSTGGSVAAHTFILSQISGTVRGVGDYSVNNSQALPSGTITDQRTGRRAFWAVFPNLLNQPDQLGQYTFLESDNPDEGFNDTVILQWVITPGGGDPSPAGSYYRNPHGQWSGTITSTYFVDGNVNGTGLPTSGAYENGTQWVMATNLQSIYQVASGQLCMLNKGDSGFVAVLKHVRAWILPW